MNREILFRGFSENNSGNMTVCINGHSVMGEWVTGGYVEILPPPVCFKEDDTKKSKHYIITEKGFADWGMDRQYIMVEVIPTTIGQSTGLLDRNGNIIFEGDIVLTTTRYGKWKGVVEFGSRGFTIKWDVAILEHEDKFLDCYCGVDGKAEIVGIIFK